MRTADLAATADIYECASANVYVCTRLSHDLFRTYSLTIKRLIRALADEASQEVWKPILAPLRRYGFSLCAAPLPFNEASICPTDIRKLHSCRDTLAMVYPAQAILLGSIMQCLEVLIQSNENPYGSWLVEATRRNPGAGAILIRDSRLVSAVERQLSSYPLESSLAVITPAQLTGGRCFDVLYVLGAARWFPSFIFDAPRSKRTELVRYAWIKDRREPARTFISAAAAVQIENELPEHEDYCDAADLLPVIDWRTIGQKIAAADLQNTLESISARLILLESDCAVFLEADDGASVLTIDLDTDESTERIARIATNDVRSGTFLLLRTSGGGDYLVTEADSHFLKERAPELREAQQRWKALLNQRVQKDGLLVVSLELIDLGSCSADEINVRNYLSPRSIRTRTPEDFKAIMHLVGLGEQWESYWHMMGEIDHAHRLAGQRIRRLLLRRLEELDLTELERVGSMQITLPEVDAGGLTAFRVLDVSPDSQLVSVHHLGHPFEL